MQSLIVHFPGCAGGATRDAAFGSPLFAVSSSSPPPPAMLEAVGAEAFAALPNVAPPACSGAGDGGFSEFDEPAAGFDAFETSDMSAPPEPSGGFDAFEPAAVHDSGGGGFDAVSAAPSVGAAAPFSGLDPFRGM